MELFQQPDKKQTIQIEDRLRGGEVTPEDRRFVFFHLETVVMVSKLYKHSIYYTSVSTGSIVVLYLKKTDNFNIFNILNFKKFWQVNEFFIKYFQLFLKIRSQIKCLIKKYTNLKKHNKISNNRVCKRGVNSDIEGYILILYILQYSAQNLGGVRSNI